LALQACLHCIQYQEVALGRGQTAPEPWHKNFPTERFAQGPQHRGRPGPRERHRRFCWDLRRSAEVHHKVVGPVGAEVHHKVVGPVGVRPAEFAPQLKN